MANDLLSGPFLYRERARGRRLDFAALCLQAEMIKVVSMAMPPDVRLHNEAEDWVVALPGRRCYLLAERKLPTDPKARARTILGRLAYGAHEWASREVLLAHGRHLRKESAPAEAVEGQARRRLLAETLPMRRLLRLQPDAGDETLAGALGVTIDAVRTYRERLGRLDAGPLTADRIGPTDDDLIRDTRVKDRRDRAGAAVEA